MLKFNLGLMRIITEYLINMFTNIVHIMYKKDKKNILKIQQP